MHDLCFICNKENFVAKVCEIPDPINIRAPRSLENKEIFIQIILNPLMGIQKIRTLSNNLLYQSSLNKILSLQQAIQNQNQAQNSELIIDSLCGWDYAIHYLQNSCQRHLEAFEFVSAYHKRRFKSYTIACFASILSDIEISHENLDMFTYVCDSLTKLLIQQYRVTIDDPQVIRQLYLCRLRLAHERKIFARNEIFNPLYDLYAMHHKHTIEFFGYLCFSYLNKSIQLWGVFYDNIPQKQKQDHIQHILACHDQKCDMESIQKLLLLAKELKRKQDYILSFIIFSFSRKVLNLIQNNEYHPFIYANLAKLILYLGDIKKSMMLYKNAVDQMDKGTLRNSMKSKINFHYLVISLYSEHDPSIPRKIIQELLLRDQQASCLTRAQRAFVELAQIFTDKSNKNSYRCNSQFRPQYCNQLTYYLMQQHKNPKVFPTSKMQEMANVIEFRGMDMTQIKLHQQELIVSLVNILADNNNINADQQTKGRMDLPKGCNIVFNILCINFIVKANFNIDHPDVMNYKYQAQCIESILSELNPELYPILTKILASCENQNQDEFMHFEHLLYTQINAFLDDYKNAMACLVKFKQQMKKWKMQNKLRKSPSIFQEQFFQVNQIVKRFECDIILAQNQQHVEFNLNNEDVFHQLGQFLFTKGEYQKSVKWLLEAGKHRKYQQQVRQRCQELYIMCGGDASAFDSDSSFDNLLNRLEPFDLSSLDRLHQNQDVSRANSAVLQQSEWENLTESEKTIKVAEEFTHSNLRQNYTQSRASICKSGISGSIINSQLQSSFICGRRDLISLLQTLSNRFEDFTLSILMREILKNAQDLPNIQETKSIIKQKSLTSGTSVWRNPETEETFCIKTISASNSKNNHIDEIKLALQEILCLLICRNKPNLCQLKYLEINIEKRKNYEGIEFNLYFPYYPDTFIEHMTEIQSQPDKFRNSLLKLIDAVDAMNKQGIYHLDLKHSNILYKNGSPYIIDFGSAYYEIDSHQINGVGQTPGYFNQNEDKSLTYTKADTYALGCIFYNLLTKKDPVYGIQLDLVDQQYREFVRLCIVSFEDRLPLDQLRQYIL